MATSFKQWMKRLLVILLLLIVVAFVYLALPQIYNPSPSYQTSHLIGNPLSEEVQNILTPKEEPARERSIMVLKDGEVVFEYGPTDKIMNGHSTRKSFLSLLYGIAIDQGLIDLDMTLAELGIDENPPLTDQEKTATIRDLLMKRSGIYLPAAGEHDSQITMRPKRESYKPGEYYFNNNFDTNALGTIFTKVTGYKIGTLIRTMWLWGRHGFGQKHNLSIRCIICI